MNAQEMWNLYSAKENIHSEYEAWAFGDDPDTLADLVRRDIKTGTSSLHFWYGLEGETLPQEGQYSVILDSCGNAVCIIITTKVYIVPFCQISPEHADREGEGDRSLSYWRKVHEVFFQEELKGTGIRFNEQMEVVCEEFIRVYP